MPIVNINEQTCDGCSICVDSCPNDVIRMDDRKGIAIIRYPQDCHTCFLCETDCPNGAIKVTAEVPDTPVPF